VVTAALAAQLGDFFQYVVERPVTLPRQEARGALRKAAE
jgi:hypothetical protein